MQKWRPAAFAPYVALVSGLLCCVWYVSVILFISSSVSCPHSPVPLYLPFCAVVLEAHMHTQARSCQHFFDWDSWDKGLGWMSFLDHRELEMGRSALPHAAAWIQGAVGLSLGRFQLQHQGGGSPPHLQPIERGLSRPKRWVSELAGGPRRAALHQAGSLPSTKSSAPRSSGTLWLQCEQRDFSP